MSKLDKIQQVRSYKELNIHSYFHIPAFYFGKPCFLLYKVIGFDPDEDMVYANQRDKKTRNIKNNVPIFEGYKYDAVMEWRKNKHTR